MFRFYEGCLGRLKRFDDLEGPELILKYRRWQAFTGWGAGFRQVMSKRRGRKCGGIMFWEKCIHLLK